MVNRPNERLASSRPNSMACSLGDTGGDDHGTDAVARRSRTGLAAMAPEWQASSRTSLWLLMRVMASYMSCDVMPVLFGRPMSNSGPSMAKLRGTERVEHGRFRQVDESFQFLRGGPWPPRKRRTRSSGRTCWLTFWSHSRTAFGVAAWLVSVLISTNLKFLPACSCHISAMARASLSAFRSPRRSLLFFLRELGLAVIADADHRARTGAGSASGRTRPPDRHGLAAAAGLVVALERQHVTRSGSAGLRQHQFRPLEGTIGLLENAVGSVAGDQEQGSDSR